MLLTEAIRRQIGAAVLERVFMGPGSVRGKRSRPRIPEAERWFSADRPIRQVHKDCAMFVGGMTAILLQSLHPLTMAAIADHSAYQSDPWGRMRRTSHFIAATTFGRPADARAAIAQVRAIHEHIAGTAPDGRPYAASDPHLLTWVHVAEIDAFLRAYTAYGSKRLDQAERDGYVADMAQIAVELGVSDPPRTQAQVATVIERYLPELTGTPQARDAARFLLVKPPLPLIIRPIYGGLAAAAVSLLPPWARRELRLPSLPLTEAVLVRPAGQLAVNTIRWGLSARAPADA
jgi:uncharacterized protein (DUF2236 family)